MIELTKLNMQKFLLNSTYIEFIEENPDTVITMNTGKKFVVKESGITIKQKIIDYQRQLKQSLEQ